MQPRLVLSCVAFVSASFSMAEMASSFESIKHKLVGGPYAGAGGMAIGAGSVGVEEFADDAEAISAIRMFPDVMRSFGWLGPGATDAEVAAIFLPALKVMLPHGGYFHDTLYGIRVTDENTVTMQTGDMRSLPLATVSLGAFPRRAAPCRRQCASFPTRSRWICMVWRSGRGSRGKPRTWRCSPTR